MINDLEPPPQVKEFDWKWTKWLYNLWEWIGDNIMKDYGLEVARGNVTGISRVNKFGRNIDVDTVLEDIWDGGGSYSWPTAAQVHDVTSTDAADDTGGTGAITVQLYGLDGDYLEANETITLNGVANVATSTSFIRIFRMIVRSAGSGGVNAGTITATGQTDATVTAQITIGYNQTLMAVYTIPANKTAYLLSYYGDINKSNTTGAVNIELFARPDSEVFQIKSTVGSIAAGSSHFQHGYKTYPAFTEKTDIIMKAQGSTNNFDVSAGFDLYLVDN